MRIFQVFWVLGLITTGYGANVTTTSQPTSQKSPRSQKSRPPKSPTSSKSPEFLSKTALSQIKPRDPVTFQESQFQKLIGPLNKALKKNQAIVEGKDPNTRRKIAIDCQLVNGAILCANDFKALTLRKFNVVQAHYNSFFTKYFTTMTGPMNQCSHICEAYPSSMRGRYEFGCRIQCACAQTCTDSYFNGRICEPIEKNNPACCPVACPLNCPKPPTCSFSGLDKVYKCACLGTTFVDPIVPDQNDLYMTSHHGAGFQPVQPIQPVQPEIIGRTQISDGTFFSNTGTNSYNGYINAQDQYMAALDRTYGGPGYIQLRDPRPVQIPSQPYQHSLRYP